MPSDNLPVLPSLTRTKSEAQQLAAELFSGDEIALARLKPGTAFPRYQLTHETAGTLRAVLFWLHEQKPRIYKRARWDLFYDRPAGLRTSLTAMPKPKSANSTPKSITRFGRNPATPRSCRATAWVFEQ